MLATEVQYDCGATAVTSVHFPAIPNDRKNIAPEMKITASVPLPAVVATTVNRPDASRPRMHGNRRLATISIPRRAKWSVTQPPAQAPRTEKISGIIARNPVLAMLICCCISRYAGSQVWYIHTA